MQCEFPECMQPSGIWSFYATALDTSPRRIAYCGAHAARYGDDHLAGYWESDTFISTEESEVMHWIGDADAASARESQLRHAALTWWEKECAPLH
jgi:hypothetical protein